MNWFQDKKFRIMIFLGIALILCGMPLLYASSLRTAAVFVGMAGGGIIGFAIAFRITHPPLIPSKPHETNLKRKAWKDLSVRFYSLIVGGVSFYYLFVYSDKIYTLDSLAGRIIMLSVVIIIGIWVAVGQFCMKKRILFGLDERQRLIYEKAKTISDAAFSGLSFIGILGLWAWFGLKTSIPIYVPLFLFMGLAFIAEIIQPILVLIQCKTESVDE